jgi:signal transduction histidine kinase
MRPEHASAEAIDHLTDELQHQSVGGTRGHADVDPEIAQLVEELHLLAIDTPVRPNFVHELERRLERQIDTLVVAQSNERAGSRLRHTGSGRRSRQGPEPRSEDEDGTHGAGRGVAPARAWGWEEAQQRELFASLPTPIVTASMTGRVTGFNAAAISLFGSPARLYGRSIRDVLPFAPGPSDATDRADAEGRIADATGRPVDVEVSRTVLGTGGDDHGYAVYVVHDISRHAEINRLREQLLYSVAHELRGPLMVLDNAHEILDTEYDSLTTQEFASVLRSARRTARRMRTLMEDLLSAGSIQSGNFVVAPRVTELGTIVKDALEIVSPSIEARGQRVELDLTGDLAAVWADARYTRQVLTNLLANASKYSPEGSVMRIVAAPEDTMVLISVSDQGSGIPIEQQAGLFERFYRVRSHTDAPGVGLGLAIAKGIVDAHGGKMGIDSEPGIGTCVWFTLPRARSRPADRRPRRQGAEAGGATEFL